MNLSYLKYAVEIEKAGSITKAAENLYLGQPNLSRAIKELEKEIGFEIFTRSPRGVYPTVQGAEFLSYAKQILMLVNEMEHKFHPDCNKFSFSASVIGAGYVAYAFTKMVDQLDLQENVEMRLEETGNMQTVHNVAENKFDLGILRFKTSQEDFYRHILKEKKLSGKTFLEFQPVVLLSRFHPLSNRKDVTLSDLSSFIEICNQYPGEGSPGDYSFINKNRTNPHKKRLYIREGSNCLDLLSTLQTAYAWDSPVPPGVLEQYSLVQLKCNDSMDEYKDMLIYKHDFQLSELDKLFIEQLNLSKKIIISL